MRIGSGRHSARLRRATDKRRPSPNLHKCRRDASAAVPVMNPRDKCPTARRVFRPRVASSISARPRREQWLPTPPRAARTRTVPAIRRTALPIAAKAAAKRPSRARTQDASAGMRAAQPRNIRVGARVKRRRPARVTEAIDRGEFFAAAISRIVVPRCGGSHPRPHRAACRLDRFFDEANALHRRQVVGRMAAAPGRTIMMTGPSVRAVEQRRQRAHAGHEAHLGFHQNELGQAIRFDLLQRGGSALRGRHGVAVAAQGIGKERQRARFFHDDEHALSRTLRRFTHVRSGCTGRRHRAENTARTCCPCRARCRRADSFCDCRECGGTTRRPRPVPSFLVVKNALNRFDFTSSVMPMPVSLIETRR